MKGLIYTPTLLSVALLLYKGAFYGSAHVQAMTLGYISKQIDKLNYISEICIRSFTMLCSIPVRVIGEMSLRNSMWHGLRNDIIMRNVKYGKWRKEIN